MRPGADAQMPVGRRNVQFVEKHVRHVGVVVLTGVDEILRVSLAQFPAQWRRLDELRPGADDGHELHGRLVMFGPYSGFSIRGWWK